MSLAIAVFVPEGIIIASDGLAEFRNSEGDNGFLHFNQKMLFSFKNKYLICVQGNGYLQGLPYAFFVEKILALLGCKEYSDTYSFSEDFEITMKKYLNSDDILTCYIAGVDVDSNATFSPKIYLIDNGRNVLINCGQNDTIVYNYHSIGRSLWLNKLLLPTTYVISEGDYVKFDNVDIDFSKYSLSEAKDFAGHMIHLSSTMDRITQLKQMVGDRVTYGILPLIGDAMIVSE